MIRRDRDKVEGPEPTTYLGLAMAAPVAAGHERPCITGASKTLMLPLRHPANSLWAGDPVPIEPPLGFSIDELPALGGASEPLHSSFEIAAPAQFSGERSGK